MREPHLDLLALAPRLLDALGASKRPGDISGVLMDIARDLTRWFLWAALGFEPSTWDLALDAVTATPENHTVLYEDDVIRVVSVTVPAGTTEKPHHHRFPSVFVIDRMVKLLDFDGVTNKEIPLPLPDKLEFPITVKFLPQPLHYVQNVDTKSFHATRVEFKKGFSRGL